MADRRFMLSWRARGLSARLLLLTLFFVMLSEVAVYVPSIARFREMYLREHIDTARLAMLALEATPGNMVSEELGMRLLDHAEAHGIVLRGPGMLKRVLYRRMPPRVDLVVDTNTAGPWDMIREAFAALVQRHNRVLNVLGYSEKGGGAMLEILIDETPMRREMYGYSVRILGLSLVIAMITAALVYVSLRWMMVRPIRRLTRNMVSFRSNPEDPGRVVVPSGRRDEIGQAERELALMQQGLRAALAQKARLAALGVAVTKISHDLRNILATAGLVSDRLAGAHDPEVARLAPRLVASIDRAMNLCSQTLAYAHDQPPPPKSTAFPLRTFVDDVAADQSVAKGAAFRWENRVGEDVIVAADRDQLFRVLVNLCRNAAEAGARTVRVRAESDGGRLAIEVADDGPGLPARAREHLFEPFVGAARAGGTGLGLAIAREIMRAHGGDISLVRTGATGTTFRLELPAGAEPASASA